MKRFEVFGRDIYHAGGGMEDFLQDFDTLAEALPLVNKLAGEIYGWAHVWDGETREIVFAVSKGDVLEADELADLNRSLQCR